VDPGSSVETQDVQPPPEVKEVSGPGRGVNVPEVLTKSPETEPEAANVSSHSICLEGSHTVPSPITPFVVSNRQLGDEHIREISTSDEGPNITVQPATPGSSTKTGLGDPFNKPTDAGKSTAINENGRSQVKSRKQQQRPPSPSPDRYVPSHPFFLKLSQKA
jgi:hypothetical protein